MDTIYKFKKSRQSEISHHSGFHHAISRETDYPDPVLTKLPKAHKTERQLPVH